MLATAPTSPVNSVGQHDTAVKRSRKAYSSSTFCKFFAVIDNLSTPVDVSTAASGLNIELKTAQNWISCRKKDPSWTGPKVRGGRTHAKFDKAAIVDVLVQFIGEHKQATLKEMRQHLVAVGIFATIDLTPSEASICSFLKDQLITYKLFSICPETTNQADTIEARYQYSDWLAGLGAEKEAGLVFVDEAEIGVYSHRPYGRATAGVQAVAPLTYSRSPRLNIIAASSQSFGGLHIDAHLEPNNDARLVSFLLAAAQEWNCRMEHADHTIGEISEVYFVTDGTGIRRPADIVCALEQLNQSLTDTHARTKKFTIKLLPKHSSMLNPAQIILSKHGLGVATMHRAEFRRLADIDIVTDGSKTMKRVALLKEWIDRSWHDIEPITHSLVYHHTRGYQSACLLRQPIEHELDFHTPVQRSQEEQLAQPSSTANLPLSVDVQSNLA